MGYNLVVLFIASCMFGTYALASFSTVCVLVPEFPPVGSSVLRRLHLYADPQPNFKPLTGMKRTVVLLVVGSFWLVVASFALFGMLGGSLWSVLAVERLAAAIALGAALTWTLFLVRLVVIAKRGSRV